MAAVSEEDGGDSDHSETERKPYEASKDIGKEPGFYFLDMDLFAFNLMYLGQYFSVEVTKNLALFGIVLTDPILWFISTWFGRSSSNRLRFV